MLRSFTLGSVLDRLESNRVSKYFFPLQNKARIRPSTPRAHPSSLPSPAIIKMGRRLRGKTTTPGKRVILRHRLFAPVRQFRIRIGAATPVSATHFRPRPVSSLFPGTFFGQPETRFRNAPRRLAKTSRSRCWAGLQKAFAPQHPIGASPATGLLSCQFCSWVSQLRNTRVVLRPPLRGRSDTPRLRAGFRPPAAPGLPDRTRLPDDASQLSNRAAQN